MPIEVEVNVKIPTLTIKSANEPPKIIDNSSVRFTTLIQVPVIPKPGVSLQLSTRDGPMFECAVTRADWSEEKSLFIISCSYSKRSISADEYGALINDSDWKMKQL